jgi:hypothetical protein
VEVFYNSGDADFPFERIQGAHIEMGIGAAASAILADNAHYWLSDKGQVLKAAGYNPQVASTPEVERAIAGYAVWSDCRSWTYTELSHTFVAFCFPTGDATWVLDTATSLWHRRTSWKEGLSSWGRHRSNCYARFAGKHLVGDFENGNLYELSGEVYSDNGNAIRAVHTTPVIERDRKMLFHHCLEIQFKAGVGLVVGQGEDPQAMLEWSDDDCRTWSNEHWASMGKIGEYTARAVWRRLGKSRNRTYRVTITDPVERVIYGGFAEVEPGNA